MKDIVNGVKEVVSEVSSGITESCKALLDDSSKFYNKLNVKLMGSYKEMKSSTNNKETEK